MTYPREALFIDGGWRVPRDGGVFQVVDPATEWPIGEAAQAGPDDTRDAIAAASAAFPTWKSVDPWRRSGVLRRTAQRLRDGIDEAAGWITLETGKPLAQAHGEVATAADYFDWFADEARRITGEIVPGREGGASYAVTREPVGVAACLTSWNFPINLPARKIAAALAAGCTVVCRPSEEAPGSAMALFRALADDDLPAGTVNLLTGLHGSIVGTLMDDARVRKMSFTGSVSVGRELIRASAATTKRLSLELGGHASAIVFDDADIDHAARELAAFKFRNAGQICISPSRFFIQAGVAEAFTEAFCGHVSKLKLGNGRDSGVDMGPLINARRLEAVEGLVSSTRAAGGRLLLGGGRPPGLDRGYFFEPTVFDSVPDEAPIMREEPFGPVVPITTFEGDDEVWRRANSLDVGLADYLFTRSEKRARAGVASLEAGMVGVNTALVAAVEAPFGGIKGSGYGSEGGAHGIDEYLQPKYTKTVALA